jgi:transketolase C-terminal domain/subunit
VRDLVEAKDLGIVAKGVMIANQMTGANAPEKIHIEADFVQMQGD